MEIFVLYETDTGIIKGSGKIDRNEGQSESSMANRISAILTKHPDWSVLYLDMQPLPDEKLVKVQDDALAAYSNDELKVNRESDIAKEKLLQIDKKSIRSIREFLVLKFGDDPDFPSFLSVHEEEAKAERAKIK